MQLTNTTGLPLSLAVWLAHDPYEYEDGVISATMLMKSLRQIVLLNRLDREAGGHPKDVTSLIQSSLGHAIHDGIHRAWFEGYKATLSKLGIPDHVIDLLLLNPDPDSVPPGFIPVYIERRFKRQINGVTVSGQLDFCAEGIPEDHKSTGVYNFMMGSNQPKYIQQLSIYRWIRPDVVTSPMGKVNYIFTDYSKLRAMVEKAKGYPQNRIQSVPVQLHSIDQTERWIDQILNSLRTIWNYDEKDLPECSNEELWCGKTVYKYYKDPAKRARSTANFDDPSLAQIRCSDDGNVGVVVPVPGKAKACLYCDAFSLCAQKDRLIHNGLLDI